jgi:putative phage-type endonuclease
MLTVEQKKIRQSGIGGSDIAAIAGLNPYKTPLDVYFDKKGLSEDTPINDAIHFGNLLEDVVAGEYARRKNVVVMTCDETLRHSDHDFMLANIDRWVGNKEYVLECKTAGAFTKHIWGEPGSDSVPESYLLQCAFYASVCNVPKVDLAVLIGGQDFRIYTYERNMDLENKIISIASNFWNNHVLKDIPPAPITQADIKTLYKQDNSESVEANPEILTKVNRLKDIKEQQKALDEEKDALVLEIQSYMKDNAVLVNTDGKTLVTWKTGKPRAIIDATKVKELYPAIYIECLKEPAPSRTFLTK